MSDARRILVRLPNWLGDALMARPLLHALRRSFPGATISALGKAPGRLLERERVWDRFLPFGEPGGEPGRGERFDAAIVLPPSFSSAWGLRGRAIRRLGFASEWRSWLLTDAVRRPPRGDRHLSDEYLALGLALGAEPAPLPPLAPSADEEALARARLARLGIGGPHVVLGPGAAYGPAKRWPVERWIALARRLAARGLAVLVAGAAGDREVAAAVAEAAGQPNVAGETALGEQLALCALARATVSNDSGLAHLAAATGAPTVALFGSTSSAWTAPLGSRVRVVQHAPVCAPCFQRTCRIGYVCLDAIAVDEVERAVAEAAA